MNLPHLSPLPIPSILQTDNFEQMLLSVKASVIEYLTLNEPDIAEAVQETIENEAEILTKLLNSFVYVLQNYDRQQNHKALQMFGMYATDDQMIDVIVSQLGVVRQVVNPGEPLATPPVSKTMESNEQVLTRYFLAAYALSSTGTAAGYRYHAMTLGGHPQVSVNSPEAGKVVVTYEFKPSELGGQIKDAQALLADPVNPLIDCVILAHGGDGTPSAELVEGVQQYITRDDIGLISDKPTAKAANVTQWSCVAKLEIEHLPDRGLVLSAARDALAAYASEQHKLGGKVERSLVYAALAVHGVTKVTLISPAESILCDKYEAPYLVSSDITPDAD